MGLDLVVPKRLAPTPVSELLGNAVLEEVREQDRVLDMGTGCSVSAILAASRSRHVVGVDINPDAVAARHRERGAQRVAGRLTFFQSDVFEAIEGRFDLIVF